MEFAKQSSEPLFPKVLWNRPINRSGGGRLLLVGGHRDEFNDIGAIYQLAEASGIGSCHVVVPDSLRKLLGEVPEMSFVPSSQSGSLGKASTDHILQMAQDFDVLMLGANLSNNSETAVMLDVVVSNYEGRLVIFGEALNAFKHQMSLIIKRPDTLIIGSMVEVFAIANALRLPLRIKDGGAMNKLEIMEQLAAEGAAEYVLTGKDMIVAAENKLSLTSAVSSMEFFTTASLAVLAAFWTQNPSKRYEALTCGAYVLQQARAVLHDKSDDVLTIQEIEKAITKTLAHDDW